MATTLFSRNEQRLSVATTVVIAGWFLFYVSLSYGLISTASEGEIVVALGLCLVTPMGALVCTSWRLRRANRLDVLDNMNLAIQRYLLGYFIVAYGTPKVLGGFFDYQLFAVDQSMVRASEF